MRIWILLIKEIRIYDHWHRNPPDSVLEQCSGRTRTKMSQIRNTGSRVRIQTLSATFEITTVLYIFLPASVADPNPDPSVPYVFGPPGTGSGSICQKLGSGFASGFGSASGYRSGSIYHQAKIIRNLRFLLHLWLICYILFIKNEVNVTSKRNKQKNLF